MCDYEEFFPVGISELGGFYDCFCTGGAECLLYIVQCVIVTVFSLIPPLKAI